MNARLDHRRILDNLDAGWPAETVTWAQAQYDAELRRRLPRQGSAPEQGSRRVPPRIDRAALRAPVRAMNDPGPARLVALVAVSAGITLGTTALMALALAWGL